MRALAKTQPAPGAELVERPVPSAGPGEVLLRIEAASICGTDAHLYHWDPWAAEILKPPIVLGHELAGRVAGGEVSAVELAPHRIRVNCVAPGAVEVERTRQELPDYAGTWGRVTPLGRVGTPEDIARAVVFLAGDESSFITGQTLWVDGGLFTRTHWPGQEG